MKARAVLFGPFVGELCWEMFRFAPHAIYLKKKDPGLRIIVLTREERFDLYGQYADILIPLRIKNDELMKRDCFKLIGYEQEYYNTIIKYFKIKFKRRFTIVDHKWPDVRLWRYKVKWQFPRNQMNYDFKPREDHNKIAETSIGIHTGLLDCNAINNRTDNDDIIESTELIEYFHDNLTEKTTTLGYLINSIKLCHYVIGDIKSEISHLALLLGIPLIHLGKKHSNDYFSILNPLNTPIIVANSIEEGVNIYENNF
jgi:hypothetical protein